jgi:hypothetical protein
MKMFEYHDYLLPFRGWGLYSCSVLKDGHKKAFCYYAEGNHYLFKKSSTLLRLAPSLHQPPLQPFNPSTIQQCNN